MIILITIRVTVNQSTSFDRARRVTLEMVFWWIKRFIRWWSTMWSKDVTYLKEEKTFQNRGKVFQNQQNMFFIVPFRNDQERVPKVTECIVDRSILERFLLFLKRFLLLKRRALILWNAFSRVFFLENFLLGCLFSKFVDSNFIFVVEHWFNGLFSSDREKTLIISHYNRQIYLKVVQDEKSTLLATIAICKSSFKLAYLFQSKKQTVFWI